MPTFRNQINRTLVRWTVSCCLVFFLSFPVRVQAGSFNESGTATAGVAHTLDSYNGAMSGQCPSAANSIVSATTSAPGHGIATATHSTYDCGHGSTGLVTLNYTPDSTYSGTDTFSLSIVWSGSSGTWTDTFNWTVTVSQPSSSSSSSSPEVKADKAPAVKNMSVAVKKTAQKIATRVAGIIRPGRMMGGPKMPPKGGPKMPPKGGDKIPQKGGDKIPGKGGREIQNEIQGTYDSAEKNLLAHRNASGVGLLYDGSSVGIGAGDDINGFALKTNRDFGTTGLSAGGTTKDGIGVWINASYIHSRDKHFTTQSSGEMWMVIGGVDKQVRDDAAVGVALTYETNDEVTNLSSAGIGSSGSSAYTVTPYAAVLLTDSVTLDASMGISWVDNDGKTFAGVTSNYDSTRYFMALNLNGYLPLWGFDLSSSFGWLSAWEDQDSYTDSSGTATAATTNKFSQVSVLGEIAYSGEMLEPFVNLRLEKDLSWTDVAGVTHDLYGATVGGGIRFNMGDFIGELNGEADIARNQYDQYSVMGNLRYEF